MIRVGESKEVIAVLQRLVAMNTVSRESTIEIGEYIGDYLSNHGFAVEYHRYQLHGVRKVNVIARKGGANLRLALAGHMDTVPFDTGEWNTKPLQLTRVGDRWFGMGVCDMKGFLAIAMVAGSRIDAEEIVLPFGLVCTSDEEVGCIGAKKLVRDRGKVADMYIIGEPSDMRPFNLHKGYMYLVIELRGKRGHSSRPDEGHSVIEALRLLLARIQQFKGFLGEIRDIRLSPPYPTLSIGVVTTGDGAAKNIIPDYCRIELDIRPIPGQDVSEIFYAFTQFVTGGEDFLEGAGVRVRYGRAPTPPMYTAPDTVVVQEVERMCGHVTCSTAFNTEGGVYNVAGSHSVICGVGSIQQAHRPNEFARDVYFTEEVVERYVATVRRLCCNTGGDSREQ